MRDATVTTGLRVFADYDTNPDSWDSFEFSGDADDSLYEVSEVLEGYVECAGWRPAAERPSARFYGR